MGLKLMKKESLVLLILIHFLNQLRIFVCVMLAKIIVVFEDSRFLIFREIPIAIIASSFKQI